MAENRDEWAETLNSPGGKSMARSPSWLTEGCPVCGHKIWSVTRDCCAYCQKCGKYSKTESDWTINGQVISYIGTDGYMSENEFVEGKRKLIAGQQKED